MSSQEDHVESPLGRFRSPARHRTQRDRLRGGSADRLDWRCGLYLAFAAAVFLFGGASRAEDVMAQPLLRATAFGVLIVLVLAADVPWRNHRFIIGMLVACLAIPFLQLVELPPAWWSSLPGRQPFLEIGWLTEGRQPWRPVSLVPDGTVNALFSLVVPITYLVACLALPVEHRRLATLIMVAGITVSAMVGLLQLAQGNIDNPLLNDDPGTASGLFANRNHQAMMLAVGILLMPAWIRDRERLSPGLLVGGGLLVTLFALMILAAGSRSGLGFGGVALLLVAWPAARLVRSSWSRRGRRWPMIAALGVAAGFVTIGYAATSGQGRAVQRIFTQADATEPRLQALPVVVQMVREYFPVGTGMGSFDPLFRMHEPLALLDPTYFNHAHNDVVEIAMTAGLAGIIAMALALFWWAARSTALIRAREFGGLRWTGAGILLFALVGSILDYPLRTPLFMVITVQAALWLDGWRGKEATAAAGQSRGASAALRPML